MKTDEILNLDYRNEENKKIIQKVLRKIKPLSKYSEDEEVPLEKIEKLVHILQKKYEITPQWMQIDSGSSVKNIYSIGVKTTTDHKWLGTVYGQSLYEVFAKLGIKMYAEVKKETVGLKSKTKEEKQRDRIIKKNERNKISAGDDFEE